MTVQPFMRCKTLTRHLTFLIPSKYINDYGVYHLDSVLHINDALGKKYAAIQISVKFLLVSRFYTLKKNSITLKCKHKV